MPCHALSSLSDPDSILLKRHPCVLYLCSTNSLRYLSGIISVFLLHLLDELDVCLLCLVGVETSVHHLFPGALLGLTLFWEYLAKDLKKESVKEGEW